MKAETHIHESHPDIVKRLKRAEGHIRRVISMFEEGRPCLDLAQQLHAVEKAIAEAKRRGVAAQGQGMGKTATDP